LTTQSSARKAPPPELRWKASAINSAPFVLESEVGDGYPIWRSPAAVNAHVHDLVRLIAAPLAMTEETDDRPDLFRGFPICLANARV
jgi:hypothetical protein